MGLCIATTKYTIEYWGNNFCRPVTYNAHIIFYGYDIYTCKRSNFLLYLTAPNPFQTQQWAITVWRRKTDSFIRKLCVLEANMQIKFKTFNLRGLLLYKILWFFIEMSKWVPFVFVNKTLWAQATSEQINKFRQLSSRANETQQWVWINNVQSWSLHVEVWEQIGVSEWVNRDGLCACLIQIRY